MKIVKILGKAIIVIGLLITLTASLAGFYGSYTAVHGMENSAENGIGIVVAGIGRAYFWSFIDIFGLGVLILGLVITLIASLMRSGQKTV